MTLMNQKKKTDHVKNRKKKMGFPHDFIIAFLFQQFTKLNMRNSGNIFIISSVF